MIDDTHRTQVIAKIPAEKLEEARTRTKTGVMIAGVGAGLVVLSASLAIRVIDGEREITALVLMLLGAPLGLGVFCVGWGATVWKGELVTASFKDLASTIGGLIGSVRKGGS